MLSVVRVVGRSGALVEFADAIVGDGDGDVDSRGSWRVGEGSG